MKFRYAFLALATACVAPIDESAVEQSLKCDDWMCGTNSPTIANRGFWDLHVGGEPNKQGFRITQFRKLVPYTLSVVNGRFRGTRPFFAPLQGAALVGAEMHISYNDLELYILRIAEVNTTAYWAKVPGQPQKTFETYVLEWSPVVDGEVLDEWTNVCPVAMEDLTLNAYRSVVFEGDRLSAETKTVAAQIDRSWFNIGCAGSAVAKMQLLGHTHAAKDAGFVTSIPERTTLLKELTGDYCGKGKAFTVAGQPLAWRDDREWFKPVDETELEARWSPSGATCLNVPRVRANPIPEGLAEFPDIDAAIAAECSLPACVGDGLGGHHLISENPL
jgi:hypothetical protein